LVLVRPVVNRDLLHRPCWLVLAAFEPERRSTAAGGRGHQIARRGR
jgi:hypothetical protein